MRFLNRVHFNLEMSPLELELYNQIRNVIGVPPNFYEFLFMIDADTEVAPDAASRMIASFIHDTKVIGICGETGLKNAKQSIITMVERFILLLMSDTSVRILDLAQYVKGIRKLVWECYMLAWVFLYVSYHPRGQSKTSVR